MANSRFHVVDGKTRRTKAYAAWNDMRARCLNPNHADYRKYGGQGIKICPEWESFVVFYLWCSNNGISSDLSIDRIDNNGDYTPDNCRWATRTEQHRNTSQNVWIEFQGLLLIQSDWAKRLGITNAAMVYRLSNWPIDRALTEAKKEC